jgi:hypothetical protein
VEYKVKMGDFVPKSTQIKNAASRIRNSPTKSRGKKEQSAHSPKNRKKKEKGRTVGKVLEV